MSSSSDAEVIVITGANEGIGFHLARALAEDPRRIGILDTNGSNSSVLKDDAVAQIHYYDCDVTDEDDVTTAVNDIIDRWGRIDILVNNAGVARIAPFEDQSMADTRREFEVNFFGYQRLIRAVLPHMLERDTGIIHCMGSGTGATGHPGMSGYSATKGAISAFVRSLRLELTQTNVYCTVLIPPSTNTRMTADLDYPAWMTAAPETVGRKLARKIHATRPVITPDWTTRIGLFLTRQFPSLWRSMTAGTVHTEK